MAIRLQGDVKSLHNTISYTIEIHDSTYVGSVIEFKTREDTFVLQYEGETEERYNPIQTSSLTITMQVQTAAHDLFISDLLTAAEKQFRIVVKIGTDIYWVGLILTDQVSYEDLPYPYDFEIRAVDGLGKLKDIDYNNNGTSYADTVDYATALTHLTNALTKIGTEDLWGTTDTWLYTSMDWWETAQTRSLTTDNFSQIRWRHKAFVLVDRNGAVKFYSSLDVIRFVCVTFGCVIALKGGSWRVIQYQQFEVSASTGTHSYTKTLVHSSATVSAWPNKDIGSGLDLVKASGGTFEALPPLQKVVLHYTHFSTQNIGAGGDLNTGTISLVDIDSVSGTAKLAFSATLRYKTVFTTPSEFIPHRHKYGIIIKVGTNYYTRTATLAANAVVEYGEPVWDASPGYYEFWSAVIYTNDYEMYHPGGLKFITEIPIPADGDLTVDFDYLDTKDIISQAIGVVYTESHDINDAFVEVWYAGTVEDQTNVTTYTATNNVSTANSKTLTFGSPLGDGPSGNAFGALYYTADGGSTWVTSANWVVATDATPRKIGQLLVNQIMEGQANPVKVMISPFYGDFAGWQLLVKSTENYVFSGGSFASGQDFWELTAWLISIGTTGATDEAEEEIYNPGTIADAGFDTDTPIKFPPMYSDTDPGGVTTTGNDTNNSDPQDNVTSAAISSNCITRITTLINDAATVTTIDINAIGKDNVILAGDQITLIDVALGDTQTFTVTADVSDVATSISVSSVAATADFREGSCVLIDINTLLSRINTEYRQYFANTVTQSITVTENGGTLPEDTEKIDVYMNGMKLREDATSGYSVSGSVITFNGFQPNNSFFEVRFRI